MLRRKNGIRSICTTYIEAKSHHAVLQLCQRHYISIPKRCHLLLWIYYWTSLSYFEAPLTFHWWKLRLTELRPTGEELEVGPKSGLVRGVHCEALGRRQDFWKVLDVVWRHPIDILIYKEIASKYWWKIKDISAFTYSKRQRNLTL